MHLFNENLNHNNSPRPRILLVFLIFLFSSAFIVSVFTATSYSATTGKVRKLCISCHESIKTTLKKPGIHTPVKKEKCTVCHNAHVSRHTGLLAASVSNLCEKCHASIGKQLKKKVIHKPVKDGLCLECHDAHASNAKGDGLLKRGKAETCYECHPKDKIASGKYVHPEVRKGNCGRCHSPHASNVQGLLVKNSTKLCEDCHKKDYGIAKFKKKHQGFKIKGSNCVECHNPHSSDSASLLNTKVHKPFAEGDCSACHEKGTKKIKSTKSDLCLKCHESTMESFNKRFSHLLPGSDSNFCLNCHSPHASASEALLKDRPDVVCYKCHEASKTFSEASRFRHPKVLDCTICHSAHGSNSRDFMKKGDGTCAVAECHESQVAFSHPVGDDVIDKRLNEPVNCVTCHNPMGAPFEKNLKGDKNTDLCNQCHQI